VSLLTALSKMVTAVATYACRLLSGYLDIVVVLRLSVYVLIVLGVPGRFHETSFYRVRRRIVEVLAIGCVCEVRYSI
jgi:hypothetical protein